MARIGYARVSTQEQSLDRQIEQLADCKKLFTDKISGTKKERPQLDALLSYIRENDIVVVTELDRLGRNNKDITFIMDQIQHKGATLEVRNLPTLSGIEDTNLRRLINNLMIELYKYQAESEWKKIRERQQQGIELAKQRGVYKGRPPQFTEDSPRLKRAFKDYLAGMTDKQIEIEHGINETTFIRYRKKYSVRQKRIN